MPGVDLTRSEHYALECRPSGKTAVSGGSLEQDFNVGGAYLKSASQRPSEPAILVEDGAISHGELASASISMARHMRRLGVGWNSTVALRSDDLVVVLAGLFATALLGARWINGDANTDLMRRAGVTLALDTDPDPATQLSGSVLVDARWGQPPKGAQTTEPPVFPGYGSPDDIWMIGKTSGTTGTPKLVGLSPRVVSLRNQENFRRFARPGVRIAGLFPFGTGPFLSRAISCLVAGGQIVTSIDPDRWVAQKVDLVFGSPRQIEAVLGARVLPDRLPLVQLSGGTAPESQVRHLLRSFEVVANGYGSTEGFNCLAVNHTLAEDGTIRRQTVVNNALVQIVDGEDRPLPVGAEGIVRISNAHLASGYIDAPAASAAAFRDGWFYPGDLGRWTEHGDFEVTGRVNDQFNLGGVKLNAVLLDHTMQSVAGIEDAICFMLPREGQPDRLSAMVAISPEYAAPDVLGEVRIALMRLAGKPAVPERFLQVDRPPRTPTGKPDRQACVAMVQAARARRRETVALGFHPGRTTDWTT